MHATNQLRALRVWTVTCEWQVRDDDRAVRADVRSAGRRCQLQSSRRGDVDVGQTVDLGRRLPAAVATAPSRARAPARRSVRRRLRRRRLAGAGEAQRQRCVDLDAGAGLRVRLQPAAGRRRRRQRKTRPHHALRKVTRFTPDRRLTTDTPRTPVFKHSTTTIHYLCPVVCWQALAESIRVATNTVELKLRLDVSSHCCCSRYSQIGTEVSLGTKHSASKIAWSSVCNISSTCARVGLLTCIVSILCDGNFSSMTKKLY